jgi:hypothetical protein
VIKEAPIFLNRFNGLQAPPETVETVGQFMITSPCHRAEAAVLMKALRVDL